MMSRGLLLSVIGLQMLAAADFAPLPNFANPYSALEILSSCVPGRPWTVAGEHGALFGRQNGKFEAWLWPMKILSDFRINAELADYPVPIDVNALAAEIKVTPAETTITYSHSAFTIRQHMFATRGSDETGTAVAAYFEIDSIRPISLKFSFTPDMLRMWPAPNFGRPNGEWVAKGTGGYYILRTDNPDVSAIVAMPRTQHGIMVPYQEHPQTYPLELKLLFDPKKDSGMVFPLILATGGGPDAEARIARMNNALPQIYAATQNYYDHFFDHRMTAETPDRRINEGLRWAEVGVDQAQVKTKAGETGMVAGYYESADSARPGYAWFFGRDTLWTTYAINSYGDYALTRRALDFLIRRQRDDGKIMHEYSQAADSIDWKATPYFYASADSTLLMVMAMWDYVRTSGDVDYLKTNWAAVRNAYEFTRKHEANDGIYSNSQGTGWVESWPPTMPQEEIYMAALDQQSNDAVAHLAELMQDSELSQRARAKAAVIEKKLESEYYDPQSKFYAFSRNADNSLDHTATIYPAVAWWDGTLALKNAGPMLNRWASSEFSTDWGTRDISDQTPFFDSISYHQGSVWPLFTGWISLAEYRAGRSLSGYAHLMQNLNLTWVQDLGSVTELLSGAFFQPLGRSSSHQTWSSAMVITPMLRGLFGLDWNTLTKSLRVAPNLPADWDHAELHHLMLGTTDVDVSFERIGSSMRVQAKTPKAQMLCLTSEPLPAKTCNTAASLLHTIDVPLKPVEVAIPGDLPEAGARTAQLKALDQQFGEHQAVFSFEGQAEALYDLPVRLNRARTTVQGGEIRNGKLHLEFPSGNGYKTALVTFKW